ncbi:MAG: type IV pilus secretin PilQ [Candidatus Aminicenantaceae bacterium]
MKRKIYFFILLNLCLFALLSGIAKNSESIINIDRIYVQPDKQKERIVLKADSSLPLLKTYYSQESPHTIIIEWDKVRASKEPEFNPKESSLIQSLKAEDIEDNRLRLLVDLKKQVPYRIFTDQKLTVVELNKTLETMDKYVLDPETEKILEEKVKSKISLHKIDISEKEDRIDVTAKIRGEAVFNIFALENPLRLVVDLFKTLNYSHPSTYQVNKLGVKRVRTAQFQGSDSLISRIVFDLVQPKYYEVKSENNKLVISFFKEATHNAPPLISYPRSSEDVPELNQELHQAQQKKTEDETPKKEPDNDSNRNYSKSLLPFPTSKKSILKVGQDDNQVPESLQEDQFKLRTIAEREKKYEGEILTLRFKDADLRDVIFYLGEFAGLNVIFDPEVSGRVTCDLVDVPWDQALDIILKVSKMGKTIEGNVLRIAPLDVLTREQEQQKRLRESKELAEPPQVKTITLSYSKAKDIQALLSKRLSSQGSIIIDERTNTLIISDVKDRIELLERLITVLDVPTPQVSIEARIVEATSNFARNLGIQWGFLGVADPLYGNQTSLLFPNSILADGSVIKQGIITKGLGGPLGGYAINLPAPSFNTALSISMGNVLDTFRLDMALTALESSGEGQIISCPKVTTQNNMQAEIIQGRQIPVQTVANFTVTTTYVNAALELRATPQITAEGTIIMSIEIRNNAADFANLVNGIPPITTQSAKATVMIIDGGTAVIGGIYRTEDSVTREGVPFLHKIPILGSLFRSLTRTRQNRELLIFITPRIIR